MKRINNVTNTSLILILAVSILLPEVSYSSDLSSLRVPLANHTDVSVRVKKTADSILARKTRTNSYDFQARERLDKAFSLMDRYKTELFKYIIRRTQAGCYWNVPMEIRFGLDKENALVFRFSNGRKKEVRVCIETSGGDSKKKSTVINRRPEECC